MKTVAWLCCLALLVAAPLSAAAQNAGKKGKDDDAAKVEELEKKLADQEKRMQNLEEELKGQIGALEMLVDEESRQAPPAMEPMESQEAFEEEPFAEDAWSEDEFGDLGDLDGDWAMEESVMDRFFNVYGFFDLTFYKNWFKSDSPFLAIINDKSSFIMTNINLYVGSQMTETLSALVELRFSFLPQGLDRSQNVYTERPDGSLAGPLMKFERENTWQREPFTTQDFWRGSVAIERVHLTYTPKDYFNIIVGRYLTPYGIWNIEHGTTVVLPAHIPYMQIREMIPLAQTGLQVYGRFFPATNWYLDYAVTVSNGRGANTPTTWSDYDENKALGLRLKATYEDIDWSLEMGGYGFYGKNTDRTKDAILNLDKQEMRIKVHNNDVYQDIALAGDILFKFHGLRLQGEFIWRRANYEIPDPLETLDKLFLTGDLSSEFYGAASFTGMGAYGLVAYELPLYEILGDFQIIPYFVYEYNEALDTKTFINNDFLFGGLNLRPSAYVAIKLEYSYVMPHEKKFGSNVHTATAQVAVSF